MRLFSMWIVAVALLVGGATARADDAATAKALFQAGAQAYGAGNFQDAVRLFRRAYELDPHPELVYNVGQAYEKLGDVPNALRSFREYLRLAPDAKDRPAVEIGIQRLEHELAERGVQQISITSRPGGARLTLDGKDVGQTPWTGEIAPGRHRAVLHAAGHPDTPREFLLTGDRAIDIDVALLEPHAAGGAAAAPAVAPAQSPRTDEPARDRPRAAPRVRPWTWATLGVGAAALAGSAGFELARQSAESDARSAPDQVAYGRDYDAMKSRQTTSRVLFGIGAIASAAGGVLLYLDLSRPDPSPTTAHLGAGCGAAWCGVRAGGHF